MAYNAMGCIICKEEEDFNVMEVAMHDTRAQRRSMPHLNDLYRFSMAALGDRVGPLSLPPSIFYAVLPLTCMGQQ